MLTEFVELMLVYFTDVGTIFFQYFYNHMNTNAEASVSKGVNAVLLCIYIFRDY